SIKQGKRAQSNAMLSSACHVRGWAMKTLIIVAAVLAALYFIGINSEPAASTAPEQTGKIVVVSLSCTAKVSYTDIKATIRNTGAVPIKFPSLFVQFGGVTEEGIAQP